MNRLRRKHCLFMALALLVVTNAFALNKGSLHVDSTEEVAGTTLAPGDYTVRWDDSNASVTLSIMRGKHLVANAVADVITLAQPSVNDSVLIDQDKTGANHVSQIFFSGKQIALQIRRPSEDATGRGGE